MSLECFFGRACQVRATLGFRPPESSMEANPANVVSEVVLMQTHLTLVFVAPLRCCF